MAHRTSSAGGGCWMVVAACLAVTTSAQIIFGPQRTAAPPPPTPSTPLPPPAAGDLGSACRTPEDRPGLCGRLQQCDSLMEHLRKRNIPYLKQSVCSQHGDQILLCCPDSGPTPTPTPTPGPILPDTCGLTHVEPTRIVGGEPVNAVGDFPWMVALSYSTEPVHKCGAALIDRRWILTAAHCLNSEGPIGARIGDLNLATTIDDDYVHPPQNIEVDQVFGHPEFAKGFRSPNKGLTNDIALVKLKTDVEYSDVVRPICLPRQNQTEPLSGKATIAGWGLTEYKGVGSIRMMQAGINFTSMDTCRSNYAALGLRVDGGQHVCASGNVTDRTLPGCSPGDTRIECQGGVDACEGDSGGPLMTFEKLDGVSRVTAVGIVSFAVGCGSAQYPGIYTRVDAYLDWIEATIAENRPGPAPHTS